MSTTYTLRPAIPLAEFTADLPADIAIDRDSTLTDTWAENGHERANLVLRMGPNILHAFVEDGLVISLERYNTNKAEPMVVAICNKFDVQMEADFGWIYPDDGRCEYSG